MSVGPVAAGDGQVSGLDPRKVDALVERSLDEMVLVPAGPVDRRVRNRLRTRRQLLSAGWRLFLTTGFDGTTIRDITDAADVGLSTFFTHFEAKADIPLDLCFQRAERVCEAFRQGLFADDSPVRRLERLARSYAEMDAEASPEGRAMTRLVMEQFFARPVPMQPDQPAVEGIILELVRAGMQAGELDSGAGADAAAQLIYAALYSTKAVWLRTPTDAAPFDLVERTTAAVHVVLRGLHPA